MKLSSKIVHIFQIHGVKVTDTKTLGVWRNLCTYTYDIQVLFFTIYTFILDGKPVKIQIIFKRHYNFLFIHIFKRMNMYPKILYVHILKVLVLSINATFLVCEHSKGNDPIPWCGKIGTGIFPRSHKRHILFSPGMA